MEMMKHAVNAAKYDENALVSGSYVTSVSVYLTETTAACAQVSFSFQFLGLLWCHFCWEIMFL